MFLCSTAGTPCYRCHKHLSLGLCAEPGDPIYIKQNGDPALDRWLCVECREPYERQWILHATYEQLLTMVNYEWALPPTTYPRYCMTLKELYQKRLAGEEYPEGMFPDRI